ncbi:hypothetical protein VPH526E571_0013 [Vibrio phage 526E57-1]
MLRECPALCYLSYSFPFNLSSVLSVGTLRFRFPLDCG